MALKILNKGCVYIMRSVITRFLPMDPDDRVIMESQCSTKSVTSTFIPQTIVLCYIHLWLFQGYADGDVYVCEFRYNAKSRSFKKIKVSLNSSKVGYSVIASLCTCATVNSTVQATKILKSLPILHIIEFGKYKKKTSQISKLLLVLHIIENGNIRKKHHRFQNFYLSCVL